MATEYDDDEEDGLRWLSEAERAALNEDDDADDERLLREIADEDAEEEKEDDAASGQEEPQASESAVEDTETQDTFHPVYQAPLPTDFQARVEALMGAQADLAKGYDEGDFDLSEFQRRQRALNEEEWALRSAALKAEMAREQQQQGLAQRWAWEQEAYFRKAENRVFRDDPVVSHAYEGALKLLAADENNAQRDMDWFLEEAGRLSREKLRSLAETLVPASPATTRGNGSGKPAVTRPRATPPTLGGIPAAAMPDPGGDEFGHLDRLTGIDAERALAKLSPDQLERYLRG